MVQVRQQFYHNMVRRKAQVHGTILEPGRHYKVAIAPPMVFTIQQSAGMYAETTVNFAEIDTTRWTRSVYWDGWRATVLNIGTTVWESAGTRAQYTWDSVSNHYQRVWTNAETAVGNTWYNDQVWNGTDATDIPGREGRIYVMEYKYVSPTGEQQLEPLTANFAPLPEMNDLNDDFYRHLERLGSDDEYLIEQIRWHDTLELYLREDENRYGNLNRLRSQIRGVEQKAYLEEQVRRKRERTLARWGVEEIPPLTPELLQQINRTSREFLAQWLSPGELELYDKEGHVKVQSGIKPEVYYIVKKGKQKRIIQYIHGEEAISLGYYSDWRDEIPEDDIVAMKVFDLRYNERAVQLKSCKIDLTKKPNSSSNNIQHIVATPNGNGTTYNVVHGGGTISTSTHTQVTNPYDEEVADLIAED